MKYIGKDKIHIPPVGGLKESQSDFETAIKASGFGRFNILLLLATFPVCMAGVTETAVISYILPSAECDLDLNLLDKGLLNAITFCGMIASALGWGYLADTRGRKKILIWGLFSNVLCALCTAMSQSTMQLMIGKFCSGFIICGPFSVLVSYLTEFHGCNYRSRIMMIVGIMYSTASIFLPVMALLVLPNDWNFTVWSLNFNSWKVFLAVCGIPSLLGGLLLIAFPETPRFLMTQGKNAEALDVFKTIYSINMRKPKETFPIRELLNAVHHPQNDIKHQVTVVDPAVTKLVDLECQTNSTSPLNAIFSKPYLTLTIRVFLLNFFISLGQNTMRLWLPQLFASLYEYEQISTETTSMCAILEYSVNKTDMIVNSEEECAVVISPSSYINNIVVAGILCVGYLLAGTVINALGEKRMLIITAVTCGTCGLALYWSSSTLITLIITSLYMSMAAIATTAVVGASVNIYPTTSRTMIVTSSMSCGRIGTIIGSVLFPIFMSFGCIPPIVMLGVVMYFAGILAFSFPNTQNLELK